MWSLLIVTLPTQPNAVRLRVWRALKALGCGALRDGAYLLPATHADALETLAGEVREHGGSASVLALDARSAEQQQELIALFDRSDAYAQWRETQRTLQAELSALGEADARRRLRGVADALEAIRRIDYHPGAAAEQALADLNALRREFDALFAQGEPHARAGAALPRLDRRKFKGKRWATRARPWVDRLASAWLIRRFIDAAGALRVAAGAERAAARRASASTSTARTFTHVGARVTFEVMVASFGLERDTRLQRIGATVHYLDVGGMPAPEAAGLETHPRRPARAACRRRPAAAAARGGGVRRLLVRVRSEDDRDERESTTAGDAPPPGELLREALSLLAEARLHQLRRAGRADRDHAQRAGRAPALDQRAALPARAQLLHAAARPRGAAARHLHRLADAPHLGRLVAGALFVLPSLFILIALSWIYMRFRRRAGGRRRALRRQAGGRRDRAARGVAHRHARAAPTAGCGASPLAAFVAIFAFDAPFPADRARGRGDRPFRRRTLAPQAFADGAAPWQRRERRLRRRR